MRPIYHIAITLSSAHKTGLFFFSFVPSNPSIHLEVFVPSHFLHPHSPHIFLSKRQNPRDRRKGTTQIEDAEKRNGRNWVLRFNVGPTSSQNSQISVRILSENCRLHKCVRKQSEICQISVKKLSDTNICQNSIRKDLEMYQKCVKFYKCIRKRSVL